MASSVPEPKAGELIPKNSEGLMDPRFLGPGPTEPEAGPVLLPEPSPPETASDAVDPEDPSVGGPGLVDPRSTLLTAGEPEKPGAPPAKPEPPPRPEHAPAQPGKLPERPMAPIPNPPQSPPPEPPAPPTWSRGDRREVRMLPRQWAAPALLAMSRPSPAWEKTRSQVFWPRRPAPCPT
jgi:hypothetical protein